MIKDHNILTEPSSGLPGPGHVPCRCNGHAHTPVPSLRSAARSRLGVKMYRKRPNTLHVRFFGKGIKPSAKKLRSQALLICESMTESLSAKIEKVFSKFARPLGKTCARKLTAFSSEIALSNVPSPLPSGLQIVRVDERLHELGVVNLKTIDLGQLKTKRHD